MQKSLIVLFALLLTAATTLQAEVIKLDPVVVTATRTGTPLSQIASSVTVITAEEIEAKQQTQVLDVLRSIPGVNIVQTGSTGGATSVYLRGTDSRHTLLLIDGIEYRDASSIGGPTLGTLSTDNIAQIEVVRGAQSVLYGSDAIGGVINIITKKGAQEPQGYISMEGGSYNTWIEKAGFSAGNEKVSSSFAVSRTDSDGFSAANEQDGNREDDAYNNTSISFNLAAQPTKTFSLNLNVHSDNSENDYDGYGPIDGDYVQDADILAGRIEGKLSLFAGKWQIAIGAATTEKNRSTEGPEYYNGYEYAGKVSKFDIQNTIQTCEFNTVVLGAETETEELDSFSYLGDYSAFPTVTYSAFAYKADSRNNAIFLQDQLAIGNFSAAAGIRYDYHDEFGGKTTWKFAPTYNFTSTGTRIMGSVGTGFKAPSLYQLYGQLPPYNVGNKNLAPEESIGWDIGVEQTFANNMVILSLAYFYNDIDDYIDYDFTDGYVNVKGLITQGVESTIELFPSDLFDLKLSYTYTDSENKADDSRLLRRPLHKGNVDLNLYPADDKQINVSLIYIGERDDNTETLNEYTVVNIAGSHQITPYLKGLIRCQQYI